MNILQVENVVTKVSDKTLLEDMSFTLKQGEIKALVGHNGAGKTTLMRTIVGTLEKHEGKIVLADKYDQDEDFLAFKKELSYIPEEPLLLTELTVMQHFQMYGLSYGIQENELEEKISRMLTGFELEGKLDEYQIGRESCRENVKNESMAER